MYFEKSCFMPDCLSFRDPGMWSRGFPPLKYVASLFPLCTWPLQPIHQEYESVFFPLEEMPRLNLSLADLHMCYSLISPLPPE